MKKSIFLSAVTLFLGITTIGQTTATNFTADDCDGTSHTLFDELDAGKIIVMTWVMPCGPCAGPAISAKTVSETYGALDNVVFYLIDDYANTACSSLTAWAGNNQLGGATTFSSSEISMSDYGTNGMPKTVVLGCRDHKIYFNSNNGTDGIEDAIDLAIAECPTAGTDEKVSTNFKLSIYPNPAQNDFTLKYNLSQNSDVNINIFNLLGEKVKTISLNEKQLAGQHKLNVDVSDIPNGVYTVNLEAQNSNKTIRITVNH
jgi:hypothetical protein